MAATEIKFGTSGWRAIIADGFTKENAIRALTGIARHVASKKPNGARIIVGRDPRFMGEMLTEVAVEIFGAHGITPLVIKDPAPTPAISYGVIHSKADGAVNFTASHNPPQYQGIKFSTPDGAPALPETTKAIEAEIARLNGNVTQPGGTPAKPEYLDVRSTYMKRISEIVDLPAIKKSGIKIVFDPFWGAARGYSDTILRDAGVEVTSVHDYRDVLFGGHAPEPDGELLDECRAAMKKFGARIGIATDGDADRFGIVDEDGTFIQPNYVIALLFDYLVETRGWKNGVAKSVATTNMVNALADHHKVELHETPVGFKYIGELIKADKIAIGGEESAGLSIRHHVPEKDGVIAGLLCCEAVARRGKSLQAQLKELFAKVGSFYPLRENFRLTGDVQQKFTTKLRSDPQEFAGQKVTGVNRKDGLKLVLGDGSWVCYRLSGTEPVVRAYTEARSEADLQKLSAAAKQWIFE
jgi:phosphoglucomutase